MKHIYIFLVTFLVSSLGFGQTLSAGDIAFVQYNSDLSADDFVFLTLSYIPEGEIIHFTDNEPGDLDGGEGTITWTSPIGGVPSNSLVEITSVPSTTIGSVSESGALTFATGGDGLWAYQNNSTFPIFLAAVGNDNATGGVISSASEGDISGTGLIAGTHAVGLVEIDNAIYNGTLVSGTKSELLQAINDYNNWIGDDVTPQYFTGTFTCSDCSAAPNYIFNGSWSPSDPNSSATTTDDILIISGSASIANSISCNSISVSPGANLTVDSSVNLNIISGLELNSASSLYSSLILNGSISGTVNYKRYIPIAGTNDLISPPLSGQEFGSFVTANPNLATSSTTPTLKAFAPFNTGTGAYENYDSGTNATSVLTAGAGYRVATTYGSALTFTGTALATDLLDVAISDDATGFAWNLIGNPYPSYIDFAAFFSQNKAEFDTAQAFQAIYGYDGSAGGWTVWNQATIDDGAITELIAPGQGFFVKAKTGSGLVDFTTAMRTTGSSDDFIVGRQASNNVALCKLNLSGLSNSALTHIYFIDGTTRGLDSGYDAGSYFSNAGDFSIFTNLVENNTGLDMAIQTLPYNDFNDVVVPLGVNANQGEQISFALDATSTLPVNINVYLEDTVANTFTLLNTGDYTITPSLNLSGVGRFFLHFSSTTLSVNEMEQNQLLIYAPQSSKTIVVKGDVQDDTIVTVYDLQGREVLKQALNSSSTTHTLDAQSLTTGLYIVTLNNGLQNVTQKIIVE